MKRSALLLFAIIIGFAVIGIAWVGTSLWVERVFKISEFDAQLYVAAAGIALFFGALFLKDGLK